MAEMSKAKWAKNRYGKLCPVCGEKYVFIRVILGEDIAAPGKVGELWQTHQQVGLEYLHMNGRYCAKRIMKYIALEEPELLVLRPGEDNGERETNL